MIFFKKKNVKKEANINSIFNMRLLLVSFSIAIIFILLSLHIANLVIVKGDEYNKIVLSQRQASYNSEVIQSRRGDILDSDGNILATSIKVYNLILDPKVMHEAKDERYINPTIEALSFIYEYNKYELQDLIEKNKDRPYIRYARQLSKEEKEKFELYCNEKNEEYKEKKSNEKITGVWFEEEYKRIYPNDYLASNIIGFVNNSGNGVMGLEQYYELELAGTNGRNYGYIGSDYERKSENKEAQNGHNLITTINSDMQKICEEKINDWATGEIGSKSASALIMNPNNGEIYAMASSNSFNLNDPRDVSEYTEDQIKELGLQNIWFKKWKNNCVQDTYEPGSTAKVMTFAAAVDENLVGKDTSFDCKGFIELDDGVHKWRIRCNNRNGHGKLSLIESLTKSCNMALAEIGDMIGITAFAKYQKAFGFGVSTNVDLPNEADTSKFVYNKNSMGRTDLATNSFGQNFNCTMVQLATAFCSCINGGYYYRPHVVKKIESSNGLYVNEIENQMLRETISENTSKLVRQALFETVETGTGKLAQIKGRNICGKTGTAEKLPRIDKNYLVSFIGCDDRDNPNLVLYVVIDQPNLEGEKQANASFATTIFHDIMKEILELDGLQDEYVVEESFE